MSGWLVFALLALVTLGSARVAARIDRGAVMLILSAVFVAAAGYAWQGSPGAAGHPRAAAPLAMRDDSLFVTERARLMRSWGESAQWLVLADGLNRAGDDRGAAGLLATQSARRPRDVPLAVGYAHALLVLADYSFTPAVALAFARAEAIDPDDPAPLYFEGLAHFEGRDLIAAERSWRALYRELPTASPWREVVAERLKLFEMMRAQAG